MTKIVVVTGGSAKYQDVQRALPDDEIVVLREGAAIDSSVTGAEILVGSNRGERVGALLDATPTVRWVHTFAAGVDGLVERGIVARPGLVVTNSSGVMDVPIAEHVMATIFAAAKRLPRHFAQQQKREWAKYRDAPELLDATLVVLGLGSIGAALARLATGVGMKVVGIRRRAAHGALGPDRLADAVADADYLAICAPLTKETRGIVDAKVIARMRPNAWLINIARGGLIDELALFAALKEGRIGGAALDVWWTEPLKPESEWWALPNVIVTPHVAGDSERVRERTVALLKENVRRWKAREPLLNVVDKDAGY